MEMFSYLWLDLMMKSVVHWSTLIYMTALLYLFSLCAFYCSFLVW